MTSNRRINQARKVVISNVAFLPLSSGLRCLLCGAKAESKRKARQHVKDNHKLETVHFYELPKPTTTLFEVD